MNLVHTATTTTSPMTTKVAATHSSRLGHVTRFISEAIARSPACMLRKRRCRSSVRISAVFDFNSALLPFVDVLLGTVMRFTTFTS